jgi:hypothetical protein
VGFGLRAGPLVGLPLFSVVYSFIFYVFLFSFELNSVIAGFELGNTSKST